MCNIDYLSLLISANQWSLTIAVINYSTFLYPFTASAKAFDQYGEMVGRYEKQVELKERAEVLATEVTIIP